MGTPLSQSPCVVLASPASAGSEQQRTERNRERIKGEKKGFGHFCSFPSLEAHLNIYIYIFFFHQRTFFFIAFLEREGRRETNINVREKHQLVASCKHLDQGANLQHRYVPWLGIEPAPFRLWDDAPPNWDTPARAIFLFFKLLLCFITVLQNTAFFIFSYTVWGKSRFIVVSMGNSFIIMYSRIIYYLLILILFINYYIVFHTNDCKPTCPTLYSYNYGC